MIYQFGILLILRILLILPSLEASNKEPIGSFALWPRPLSAHDGEPSIPRKEFLYHFLVLITLNRARRIDQTSARFHHLRGVRQKPLLILRKRSHVVL